MQSDYPIIHIVGLPGAGKSSLAMYLAEKLGIPSTCVGKHRAQHSANPFGEMRTWMCLKNELSSHGWKNIILETTGLNNAECLLRSYPAFENRVVVKLKASKETLHRRIDMKPPEDRGDKQWMFRKMFPTKHAFVDKLYDNFQEVQGDITIATDSLSLQQVGLSVLKAIRQKAGSK